MDDYELELEARHNERLQIRSTSDFSDFEKSLMAAASKRDYLKSLPLKLEIFSGIFNKIKDSLISGEPKDGFIKVANKIYNVKDNKIIGEFFVEIPDFELDPKTGYYSLFRANLDFIGRSLEYGKQWGPLASSCHSCEVLESGEIIEFSRCLS